MFVCLINSYQPYQPCILYVGSGSLFVFHNRFSKQQWQKPVVAQETFQPCFSKIGSAAFLYRISAAISALKLWSFKLPSSFG